MKKSLFLMVLVILSCQKEEKPILVTPEQLHSSIDKVTEIMIHDIFSPPVASRIYAYPNIAAYEIISLNDERFTSLAGQIHELTPIPSPDAAKPVNNALAALVAHMDLSRRLIFSEDKMEVFRDSLYAIWTSQNEDEFEASKEYGLQ
ncbi:MAG: phosphatidic acid phosphatase, partial [Eudoraea sp.]|nr:phosphatidic acid phosphatase [Eudoraea sp.]